MTYLLLILGFALLVKGADWLVDGSTRVAEQLGVSQMVIGLTIVAMGTSMPELVVSVLASYEGRPDLSIGNVLGSNIANVLLILGCTAIIIKMPVPRNTILSEVPFSLAAALLVGFLANSHLWYEDPAGLFISRGDGVIIMFFFLLFLAYTLTIAREGQKSKKVAAVSPFHNMKKSALLILGGVAALFLGGKWVVDSATEIALQLGLSETLIGLTVVALGTSLPEFVTSIAAALKKNTDIAIGNAVGSNIFNLLFILGISAFIRPLPFNVASNADIMVVIASSTFILMALILGRRMSITRKDGIVFVAAYLAYLFFVVNRG
jgi:cation:H+ antiporter